MKLLTEYDSNHNNSNDTHHDHHLKKKMKILDFILLQKNTRSFHYVQTE